MLLRITDGKQEFLPPCQPLHPPSFRRRKRTTHSPLELLGGRGLYRGQKGMCAEWGVGGVMIWDEMGLGFYNGRLRATVPIRSAKPEAWFLDLLDTL